MSGGEAAVALFHRPIAWFAALGAIAGVGTGVAFSQSPTMPVPDIGHGAPIGQTWAVPGNVIIVAQSVLLAGILVIWLYNQWRKTQRENRIADDAANEQGLRGELRQAQESIDELKRKVASLEDRNATAAAEYKGRLEAKEEHASWLKRINEDLRGQVDGQARTLRDLADQVAAMAETMAAVDRSASEAKEATRKEAAKTRKAVARQGEQIKQAVQLGPVDPEAKP